MSLVPDGAKVDGEVAGIQVPDSVVKQWYSHGSHGNEFRAWHDSFVETWPKPTKTAAKRTAASGAGGPLKKTRNAETEATPDMTSLADMIREHVPTETEIAKCSLLNLQKVDLIVQAGSMFVQSVGEEKVHGH